MPSPAKCLLLLMAALIAPAFAAAAGFDIAGTAPGGWAEIFTSVGFTRKTLDPQVLVVGKTTAVAGLAERVRSGLFVVVEGNSEAANLFGFLASSRGLSVQSVVDSRRAALDIVWEHAHETNVFATPDRARVFAFEKWTKAPVMAGFRDGEGGVLWVIAPPGRHGYERFPYLLHALFDLGLPAPFQSRRLWAFFDSSYRMRVDLEYFAERWRRSGIAGLQVAAWHYWEPDPERDEYLARLISACHRSGILVYAWLELPHVSEKFWDEHPGWREKTAVLQDAHLDWRKLMNLANPACFNAVSQAMATLLGRFDWDGVNLAELYFESLEGASNAARFTPMNADVRKEFRERKGFDPLELFSNGSPRHLSGNSAGLRAFLEYRSELCGRLQVQAIREIEKVRSGNPDLDLVLTHVDDRFDTGIREALGADASRLLPLLESHNFTFLIEDPATIWHLGPQRYPEIARRYRALTRRSDKLAVDINVVERYQNVYPTKQQTGTELFQLIHLASQAFGRVALYFENSILPPDLPLLPSASAVVDRFERTGDGFAIESRFGVGVPWHGPATVNGKPWPALDGTLLWLPPGRHIVEPAVAMPPLRLLDFTGGLKKARAVPNGIELSYESSSRAYAVFDKRVLVEVDGDPENRPVWPGSSSITVSLPRGQHVVSITGE